MAGHSKFKNIQHRKGAQDKKRAKLFTKLIRDIVSAAKISGIDINSNPRLKNAISYAKSMNLPKDRIDKALDTSQNDNLHYEGITYEAFYSGIAFIIEVSTDNRNRSASDIRAIFNKVNGTLADKGSVSFMFRHIGLIQYLTISEKENDFTETAIDTGASDIKITEEITSIYTEISEFSNILNLFTEKFGPPKEASLAWIPNDFIVVEKEKIEKILKVIDQLEDLEDVQNVFYNSDI